MTAIEVIGAVATALAAVIVAAGGWWVSRAGQREEAATERARVEAEAEAEAERLATEREAHAGTIRSSEAVTLWEAQDRFRRYLTEQLEQRDERIHDLEEGLDECRARAEECARAARSAERAATACEEREALLRRGLQDARERLRAAGL